MLFDGSNVKKSLVCDYRQLGGALTWSQEDLSWGHSDLSTVPPSCPLNNHLLKREEIEEVLIQAWIWLDGHRGPFQPGNLATGGGFCLLWSNFHWF